jgi:arylformamidase
VTYDPFNIRAAVPEAEALSAGFATASVAARQAHRNIQGIAYGDGPRQKLDLFFPAAMNGPAPVHIFIHGGYWRGNDRENFAFPAETIVRSGAIAVIVEYTLMPGARMAQLVGEVRKAAAWVSAHIGEHGGDPARISASGHSAGAHLASYLAALAPHEHGFPGARIRALLLISGIYDLRPITSSFLQPELHLTPEEVNEWSPFEAVQSPETHVTLVVGKKETEPFHVQAQDFAFAAEMRGAPIERITVPGHDHMTIARDLGVPGTRMAELLAEVIDRTRG